MEKIIISLTLILFFTNKCGVALNIDEKKFWIQTFFNGSDLVLEVQPPSAANTLLCLQYYALNKHLPKKYRVERPSAFGSVCSHVLLTLLSVLQTTFELIIFKRKSFQTSRTLGLRDSVHLRIGLYICKRKSVRIISITNSGQATFPAKVTQISRSS